MKQSQIGQYLLKAGGFIQPLSRWYLDLLRNVLVVAAFLYLAEKSQNEFIKAMAAFSKMVLSVHCLSYVYPILDRIPSIRFIPSARLRTFMELCLGALAGVMIYRAFTYFYDFMMSQLVQSQPFR
jgi:flagellar biosynthesis protein FliR